MAVMPIPEPTQQEGTVTTEVDDRFWCDRFGPLRDPFGHAWSIAAHVEDVPPGETAERATSATAATAS